MLVEDQIRALRQLRLEKPFGWLICYENRPLQGIPPKGAGAHILFFSSEDKAGAFISGRKRFFPATDAGQRFVETLSVVAVDSPDTLKSIALNPSNDTRYAAPPCGIVLDFDYARQKARQVIAPGELNNRLPVEIARAFGFKLSQGKKAAAGPSGGARPEARGGQKRPRTAVLISVGAVLALVLVLACLGAAWYGMRHGMIPALPFMNTPTATKPPTPANTPTLANTPSSTPLPTETASATATQVVWEINVGDNFSSNTHSWPLGLDKGQYGSSNIAIQNGKLVWDLNCINNCWYWWYPDLPVVTDFDVSVDVKRASGSTSGDYGIVVRADGTKNSFYYLAINDTNRQYAFLIYQNETWTRIHDWTDNATLAPGNVNHIEIQARGARFVFLINGVEAGQAQDARLSSGRIGILSELYDTGDKIQVEYDNLVLHGNR
jgi:3-keto-disaccharide hydrolase